MVQVRLVVGKVVGCEEMIGGCVASGGVSGGSKRCGLDIRIFQI